MGIKNAKTAIATRIKDDRWEIMYNPDTHFCWVFMNNQLISQNRTYKSARKSVFANTGISLFKGEFK